MPVSPAFTTPKGALVNIGPHEGASSTKPLPWRNSVWKGHKKRVNFSGYTLNKGHQILVFSIVPVSDKGH